MINRKCCKYLLLVLFPLNPSDFHALLRWFREAVTCPWIDWNELWFPFQVHWCVFFPTFPLLTLTQLCTLVPVQHILDVSQAWNGPYITQRDLIFMYYNHKSTNFWNLIKYTERNQPFIYWNDLRRSQGIVQTWRIEPWRKLSVYHMAEKHHMEKRHLGWNEIKSIRSMKAKSDPTNQSCARASFAGMFGFIERVRYEAYHLGIDHDLQTSCQDLSCLVGDRVLGNHSGRKCTAQGWHRIIESSFHQGKVLRQWW